MEKPKPKQAYKPKHVKLAYFQLSKHKIYNVRVRWSPTCIRLDKW